jgi:hypothetical protein
MTRLSHRSGNPSFTTFAKTTNAFQKPSPLCEAKTKLYVGRMD